MKNEPPTSFMLMTGKCSKPQGEVDGTDTLLCTLPQEEDGII